MSNVTYIGWNKEKIELLASSPDALAIRAKVETALRAYIEYFRDHGIDTGIRITVGSDISPTVSVAKGRTH